jgi:hypothetical protein
MYCFSFPSAPTPRSEDLPLALSEPGILALCLGVLTGEFASGLTAEGSGGAAGGVFAYFFRCRKK